MDPLPQCCALFSPDLAPFNKHLVKEVGTTHLHTDPALVPTQPDDPRACLLNNWRGKALQSAFRDSYPKVDTGSHGEFEYLLGTGIFAFPKVEPPRVLPVCFLCL
jgi:hypothetical protein